MATYAAFKHVELHKVGHGKNRVPNAPRGCIGEIFGDGSQNNSATPTPSGPETPSRPRDTHSRLFGGPTRAGAVARTDAAGSAPTNGGHHGYQDAASQNNGNHGHVNGQSNGNAALLTKEGNPITGEGYKSMNGEINTYVAPLNGNATPINHNRVPPGGHSSGLW